MSETIKDTEKKTTRGKAKAEPAPKAAEPAPATEKKPAAKKAGLTISATLKVGKPLMQGAEVKAVQEALIKAGYHCGVEGATGVYGKDTARAVRLFQSMKGLIVDGRVGPFTIKALGGSMKN